MNRNIVAFLILFGAFTQLMHVELGVHYLVAYIAFAPIAMLIFCITIVPVMLLQKNKVVNQNYEVANVLIVVAVVESVLLLLTVYVLPDLHYHMIIYNSLFEMIVFFTAVNVVAFFGDYDRTWPYVMSALNILFIVFSYWILKKNYHPFFADIGVFYMLIHTVFVTSYIILRRVIVYRFPPRGSYASH